MNLTVTEAIRTRRAIRQFTHTPVTEDLLREILDLATLAPSGGNVQPWTVHALTGDALSEFVDKINGHIQAGQMDELEFPIYPSPLAEPFRTRRYACGEKMYEALEIPQDDKMARIQQVLKNFSFFGAPVGIILTMKRDMSKAQALDIGIYAQSLMLLARERGLDTCPQLSWASWPAKVREALALDEEDQVMMGIALGYAEVDAPVNQLNQPRAPLAETTHIYGY